MSVSQAEILLLIRRASILVLWLILLLLNFATLGMHSSVAITVSTTRSTTSLGCWTQSF